MQGQWSLQIYNLLIHRNKKVIDVLHKKNFGHFAHTPYLHTWFTMTADSSVYTSCTQLADSA